MRSGRNAISPVVAVATLWLLAPGCLSAIDGDVEGGDRWQLSEEIERDDNGTGDAGNSERSCARALTVLILAPRGDDGCKCKISRGATVSSADYDYDCALLRRALERGERRVIELDCLLALDEADREEIARRYYEYKQLVEKSAAGEIVAEPLCHVIPPEEP